MSLDLGSAFSWIDPEGDQIRGAIRSIVDCASEQRLPRIGIVGSFWNPILLREVLAHGMPLVAMHTTLSLLEIDRVRWKVPVDHCVAVWMEIQAFLPNGRRGEDEGPEW